MKNYDYLNSVKFVYYYLLLQPIGNGICITVYRVMINSSSRFYKHENINSIARICVQTGRRNRLGTQLHRKIPHKTRVSAF